MRGMGITSNQLQEMLNQLAYIPVITAHPTEAKRPFRTGRIATYLHHQ